jgi:hypothetical protein
VDERWEERAAEVVEDEDELPLFRPEVDAGALEVQHGGV